MTLCFHRLELASQAVGLQLNASKTKFIHLNPSAEEKLHVIYTSVIEKAEAFQYLGTSIKNVSQDIECWMAKAWSALKSLAKVWIAPLTKSLKYQSSQCSMAASPGH